MKILALPVLAGALALGACAKTEDTTVKTDQDGAVTETTTTTSENGAMTPDTATTTTTSANDGTTTVSTGPNGTSVKVDGRDVDVNAGPGGVTATVTPTP